MPPIYPVVKPALEEKTLTIRVSIVAERSVRKRSSLRHGESRWITAEVDFGGVQIAPVHVTTDYVNWPPVVTFTKPTLQDRVENALSALYQREEGR